MKSNSCQKNLSWKNSIRFNQVLLLIKSDIALCHQKPNDHFHILIKENCKHCHNTNKWGESIFQHAASFRKDHNHLTTFISYHSTNNYSFFTS